jgi:hypothetical protein
MLAARLPDTLTSLLVTFAPCFSVRTLATFQALVAGVPHPPGAAHHQMLRMRHRGSARSGCRPIAVSRDGR